MKCCKILLKSNLKPLVGNLVRTPEVSQRCCEIHMFSIVGLDVTLQWYQKTATRLPESLMFLFTPEPNPQLVDSFWYMSKMGSWIDPANVVRNGSQYMHGKYDATRLD